MKRPNPRSLTLKCPTWEHVEAFYARKVSADGSLSARVPFQPAPGETIALALELPDGLVIAIDAEVQQAVPAPDGVKSAVKLHLSGLTSALRRRLEGLVADALPERGSRSGVAPQAAEGPEPHERADRSTARPGDRAGAPPLDVPPPLPTDAPVDEPVAAVELPTAAGVPVRVRPLFEELDRDLRRMRGAAAHDVLGVKWDAPPSDIRRAYFEMTKRLHPDVLARHRSPEIDLVAEEVFIAVNRAYDPMRAAAVESGGAIAAGPDLLPHRGWVAGFEDIGTVIGVQASRPTSSSAVGSPAPALTRAGAEKAPTGPQMARPGSETGGGRTWRSPGGGPPPRPSAEVLSEARALMSSRQWGPAREVLAESLRRDPRNRKARALYHLASAEALLESGKSVDARTQLEVALAHDPELAEARAAMDRMQKPDAAPRSRLLGRLFK